MTRAVVGTALLARQERSMNRTLVPMLSFDPTASMRYQHPGDTSLDVTLRTADTDPADHLSADRPGS